ncbi:hypothetical protein BN14_05843 [Rhizoctonia solani AG-1 IB]|nr:hypothetical protein BN14_05843 [Rhizoctonia solani AG-1 IB]
MQPGSARWTAPELLLEGAIKTKKSDIYALGMGGVPNRPMELKANEPGDQMWELLMSCWDKDPSSRPSARELIGSLALISTEEG